MDTKRHEKFNLDNVCQRDSVKTMNPEPQSVLTKRKTFYHHAATFCPWLPLIGFILELSYWSLYRADHLPQSRAGAVVDAFFMEIIPIMCLLGFILSIVALFGIRRYGCAGLLGKALVGLVICLLMMLVGIIRLIEIPNLLVEVAWQPPVKLAQQIANTDQVIILHEGNNPISMTGEDAKKIVNAASSARRDVGTYFSATDVRGYRFTIPGRRRGERTSTGDFHVHELAAMPFRAIKHHNLVAARPASHPRRILFARPFDQNLHLPPDECSEFASGDFVDDFEQALVAFLADFLRHLSGMSAAGVSRRCEYLKMYAWSNSTSRASDRVCSKSSSVSPGKPTMMSVLMPISGRARRNFSMMPTKRARV